MKISKKLIEAVVGYKIKEVKIENNKVFFKPVDENNLAKDYMFDWIDHPYSIYNYISIFEFSYKCKSYAYKMGYIITSNQQKTYVEYILDIARAGLGEVADRYEFKCNSEPESIIKTAEWVSKQRKYNVRNINK